MSQTATAHHPVESDEIMGAPRGKVGMWLFLASDSLTFGALLATYAAIRIGAASWPVPSHVLNIPLTALNTFILICSSVTMVKALSAIRHGDQAKLVRFLLLTMLGGIIFLSIQAYEYTHLLTHGEMFFKKDLFCSTFFSLTGFHGMHVLAGVIYLGIIAWRAKAGDYSADNYIRVEVAGLYWHFVDLVWILVFTFVYLL